MKTTPGARRSSRAAAPHLSILAGIALWALAGPVFGQDDSWTRLREMSPPRRLLAAAAEGGKIYTFGGCGSPCFAPPLHTSTFEETRVEVYDPKLDSPGSNPWSVRKPIPAILFGAAAAAPGNGRIYLFGGFVTGKTVLEYDPAPANDSWTTKTPMPTLRHGLAAVALGGKIYVLGGSNGSAASNALEVYDPDRDSWSRKAPMPTARVFLAAAAVNGKIYAIGGSPDCCGNSQTNVVEVYDPARNVWTTAAPLPIALQTSAAVGLNGKVYVFGGFIPGSGVQGTTFEYDPATNHWSRKSPLRTPRDQAPAVLLDGQVYLIGGSVACHCRPLGDNDRYDPPTEGCLSISKTVNPSKVCPGDPVTYEITVSNDQGLGLVTGATVIDNFSSKLESVSWTCTPSGGATCTSSGGPNLQDQVNLPPNGAVRYSVNAMVTDQAAGRIDNEARVIPPPGITDPDCDHQDMDITNVLGDLAISVTGEEELGRGDVATYTIVVDHTGSAMTGVEVSAEITGGTPLESPPCDINPQGGFTCDLGNFPAGPSSVVREFKVQAPQGCPCPSPIEIEVTVTANEDECDEGNNTATATTDVTCVADLAIDKTIEKVTPSPVQRGSRIDYALKVTNNGPDCACKVTLNDPVPVGLVSPVVPPGCVLTPANEVHCRIGELCEGASRTFLLSLTVPPAAACKSKITNTATGTDAGGTTDPNLSNNSVMVMSTVACCDLAISKTDGLTTAMPGQALLYEITVQNLGNVDTDATVEDPFPMELTNVLWCRGAGCVPNRSGDLVDTIFLPAGSSVIHRVQGIVSAMFTGTLSNTATVKGSLDCVDVNPGNNSSTDVTEITCTGVKALWKEISGPNVEGGAITYTVELLNCGPNTLVNDLSVDEFSDPLPASLTLTGASASSGIATTGGNTAMWNGSIPAGGTVTITITATINAGTAGTTICNQATVNFDADGNGTNESSGVSDDPNTPAPDDPCCFPVVFEIPIPALSLPGLLALALLLVILALLRLRRARG
jgi:uncharacterized repeat protein (TIGR01451 family)